MTYTVMKWVNTKATVPAAYAIFETKAEPTLPVLSKDGAWHDFRTIQPDRAKLNDAELTAIREYGFAMVSLSVTISEGAQP